MSGRKFSITGVRKHSPFLTHATQPLKNRPAPIPLAVGTLVPYSKPERMKKVLRGGHAEGAANRSIAKLTVQNPYARCSLDSGSSEDESGPFKSEVRVFSCRIFRAVAKGNQVFMQTVSLITS